MGTMRSPSPIRALAFIGLATFITTACGDDDAPVAAPGASDGGASSSGATTSSGGSSSGSSGKPVVEPTCTATAGEPSWGLVDTKLDWKTPDGGGPLDPRDNGAIGLAYGNGVFVLVAATFNHDRIRWATSPDGLAWTQHEQKTTESGAFTAGSEVHFNGKKFVFFGGHTNSGTFAYSSADGAAWEAHKVDPGAVNVSAFASNAEGFTVAAGANGSLRSSPDLVTWANHGEGVTSYLNVAFGNGRWIATSNGAGQIFGGTDGSQWSPLTITPTPPGGYANLVFGRGFWTLAGGGNYLLSADGVSFAPAERTGDSQLGKTSLGQSRFAGNRLVLPSIDYFTGKATFAATTDGKQWDNFGSFADTPKAQGPGLPTALVFGQCRYLTLVKTSPDGNLHSNFYLLGASSSPAP